jgi:hypothetical protein
MFNFVDNIETNFTEIREQIQNLTNKFSSLTEKNNYEDILSIETEYNNGLSYSDIISLKKELEKYFEIMNTDDLDINYYENREIKKELDDQCLNDENFKDQVKDLSELINELINIKNKKEKLILKK